LQADISITRSDTRNCGFGNRVQTVHIEPNNAAEYAGFIWREPEVVIVPKRRSKYRVAVRFAPAIGQLPELLTETFKAASLAD
jgi:hypothetical protein